MTFPDLPRVVYRRNPLDEVLCQLRFPTILRIESDLAPFQERVRSQYPLYEEEAGPFAQLPPEIAQMLKGNFPGPAGVRRFLSPDRLWTLAITREFLALSTRRYARWEEFRERLQHALGALLEIYGPAFFSRVGLRYRNVIRRPDIGVAQLPWDRLLRSYITAELSTPISEQVREAAHVLLLELDDGIGKLLFRHGLLKEEGRQDLAYSLDGDFYTDERTEIPDALERLDQFNREARRLFRWCITDDLHERLEPQRI